MIDNLSDRYSKVVPVQYPKAGTTNSACKVGVIPAVGGKTVWMQTPGGYQQAMDGPSGAAQPWMMLGPQVNQRNWMMLGPGEEMTSYGYEPDSPMGHAIVGPGYDAGLASYQQTGDKDPYSASYQT